MYILPPGANDSQTHHSLSTSYAPGTNSSPTRQILSSFDRGVH